MQDNRHNMNDKLDSLREITTSLLEEVKSLGSPKKVEFQDRINFNEEVKRFEIYLIERALNRTGGSQLRAARILNLKHTTLHSKIKRYHIPANGKFEDTQANTA
jgi:transcriptional regulator with GAF, ATPase, and Fis domain